ncbi:peptidylprolyl isomerase [Tamilnaduibacter salinus]|nr:peptidylprolyl isomerase [Tamilnaduibacter salinus]
MNSMTEVFMTRNRHFLASLILGLVAVLGAGTALAERQPLDRVIAIVNDGVILQSELENRIKTVTSRLRGQGTGVPPRDVLEERVLDQLIQDAIQLQMADRAGMRISDNELNDTMRNIASRNNMTLDEFEAQLNREGLSYQQAREQIRREMLISRVQQRQVGSRVRVTQREIDNFNASRADQAQSSTEYKLAHILVAVDDTNDEAEMAEAREKIERLRQRIESGTGFQQVAVAESDGTNALEGGILGWRQEGQLPSLVSDVVPSLPVGETSSVLESGSGFHLVQVVDKRGGDQSQSRMVEQHQVRHILIRPQEAGSPQEARATIEDLYQRIGNGASFATLAREYSDDKVSGNEGGRLGWVSPGEMVPAFEEQMMQAPVGVVTEPFRSRFGWHILEVRDEREKDMTRQIQTNKARQALYQRKFDSELQTWLREIRAEAFIEIKSDKLADDRKQDDSGAPDGEDAA